MDKAEPDVNYKTIEISKGDAGTYLTHLMNISTLEKCLEFSKDKDERDFWRKVHRDGNLNFHTFIKTLIDKHIEHDTRRDMMGFPNINPYYRTMTVIMKPQILNYIPETNGSTKH